MKVNFVNLGAQYEDIKQEVLKDVEEALTKGAFMGCEEFEKKFAEYHGLKYCVGVGSGTDALLLSLLALGIGPGDEVIVPANTYIATAFAVSHTGAIPVFVDPDPNTYTMSLYNLEKVITSKTKAIIPVHLYGYPADMKDIIAFALSYDLYVIEDCAQSIGAVYKGQKTGTFGHIGCYSFYPAKNLGGLGQGGAIVTDDNELAEIVRELGNVGRSRGSWFDYSYVGYNSRLDAINAKFLIRGLEKIDDWNGKRREAACWYSTQLKDVPNVRIPTMSNEGTYPVFHLYELKLEDKKTRDVLKDFLGKKEIAVSMHYPKPCHRQVVYENLHAHCPISDELADTLLSLPMHPNLTEEEVEYVCSSIKEFFNGLKI